MRRQQVFVRAIKANGKWGSVDVFDLDDESFRAFVVKRLWASGQIVILRDDVAGEVVILKEKKSD